MTRLLVVTLSAAVLALSAMLGVAVARAEGCNGYNGRVFSNSTCDSYPYLDGSFDRCTSTNVFGFYNYQCVRIYP